MKAAELREQLLKSYPDFKQQKMILEYYIKGRGHVCLSYLSFTVSSLSMYGVTEKKQTHAYADGTITRPWQIIPEEPDSVTTDMIKSSSGPVEIMRRHTGKEEQEEQ